MISPVPAGPVVSNNTPLVSLWVLGRLDFLQALFGTVLIPPAVAAEFVATERPARAAALRAAPWIQTVPLASPRRAQAFAGLDLGEAEVLALAEECEARLVLLDERRGRRYAHRMGFPLTGTLGVLLLAKEQGLIATIKPLVVALEEAGLYISPALRARVLALAQEGDPSDGD